MAEYDILGSPVQEERVLDNSYLSMFSYFDSRYGGDTERINYAHVLESMKNEKKVSSLVNTYNKVLYKILLIYYRSVDNFPSYWVEFMTEDQQWLWDDLKSYLNDQIKRVFNETPYTDTLALECITNLRDGLNEGKIRSYITSKSSDEVLAILNNIVKCKETVKDAPKHMSQFNIDTNDYIEYKPQYINDIKFLIKNGYHKGYNDEYFETKAKISYFPNTQSVWVFILLIIIILPLSIYLLKDVSPITIIIILGIIGALPKLLLTGKL